MSAKDVIIALDFPTREETLSFLDQFPAGEKPFVKIGMELFYAEGPQVAVSYTHLTLPTKRIV